MFDSLTTAAPDPILGLSEAFQRDENPQKINLTVGVFKDESGQTPILASVKAAEERLLSDERSKSYLGIDGLAGYCDQVRRLLFGDSVEERAVTLQTPGGTGALRVAADLLHQRFPQVQIWCSTPTWANHSKIFGAAGVQVQTYAYLDTAAHQLDFEAAMADLEKVPAGDVVCLHCCCHNPSGVDPQPEQWTAIAALCRKRNLLPLLDCAYQGFGDGLYEDAEALRQFVAAGCEMMVCSSYSKNFSLYNERVGALTLVTPSATAAKATLSHAKIAVRTNYSNPPKHGAAIVATILGDSELRSQWESELAAMRSRIHAMRQLFVEKMTDLLPERDFSFIARQRGMFSFSGLTPLEVDALRSEFGIYIVGSGRINVAGITPDNVDYLCQSLASVSAKS